MLGDGGMLMITGVASVGNGTDTLHYAYRPGLSQLETATWRNSQDAVLNSRTYAYDAYHRLTGINLNNASEVAYTLNDKDQRTAASYAIGGTWSYSYDEKSQVTGATGSNTTFSYAYDGIGNRLTAAEGSDTWSYTSNLLNQYTAINSDQPTYDADGNMLTTGDGWLYTWNGENRLIRAESGNTLVEMAYDYMGRRIEKKVSSKGLFTFYNWNVDKHYKFAYDDYKLIAVYDAANNNALLMTFTWQPESVGLDVPVSMAYDGNTYYYVTDGNKNVTGLLDQAGNRVAEYVYGPFGQLLGAEGELAEVNPFRFSSEYADDETGLVYYNYRYYNAKLGRWIKRDSIEEEGGMNLYGIVANNMINNIDENGLKVEEIHIGNTYSFHVYSDVRFYDFWSSSEYLGTVTFEYKPNSVVQDNEAGLAIAQQLARQIDNGSSLAVLAKTISDGAGCLELTLRVAVVGLDQVISVVELAQDPSIATAIGAITVIPGGGALAKKVIPLSEFRRLMKKWDKATYDSLADSIRDHASRHGFGNDYLTYLRKASNFNKKGAHKTALPNGASRWNRENGEFLIERKGKIVSYGYN